MTSEQFAPLDLPEKWEHIRATMSYIQQIDEAYNMRRRLNPHHSKNDVKLEERNLRLDQYQRWSHIKDLYAAHRDELNDTLGDENYQDCKSILERIFTLELDDALRDIVDEK